MPYMIYQQYKTAIKSAYAGRDEVASQHAEAKRCRLWLASLEMEPRLRDPLVEQLAALEEAFGELLREDASA